MSAWAELVHYEGDDEWQELCDRALKEIQDAHAHKLAEKIRRGWDETRGATQASKVMAFAADLIDSEVD